MLGLRDDGEPDLRSAMNATLSYEHEGLRISVAFDRYVSGERHGSSRSAWRYVIATTDGETLYEATDLESPTYDMVGALRSLHSFLSAWDESRTYNGEEGESAGLFPAELHDKLDWGSWLDYAYGDLYGEGERT